MNNQALVLMDRCKKAIANDKPITCLDSIRRLYTWYEKNEKYTTEKEKDELIAFVDTLQLSMRLKGDW